MRRAWEFLTTFFSNKKIAAITQQLDNLRQYGARSLDDFDLTQPVRHPTPTEVRGLATGAILFFWGDRPIKILPRLKPEPLAEAKAATAEWWGIQSTAEALDTLQWLRQEGHRHDFHDRLKRESLRWHGLFATHPFLKNRAVTSVAAWDYGRMVNVARWCYDYGYLSWEQAWELIDAGTRLALREYDSWESFAAGFLAGRLLWNPDREDHADLADVASYLLERRVGMWHDIAWQPYPVA